MRLRLRLLRHNPTSHRYKVIIPLAPSPGRNPGSAPVRYGSLALKWRYFIEAMENSLYRHLVFRSLFV